MQAINNARARNIIKTAPETSAIASISVGICNGEPVLDLDYDEDSTAETDMNVIMNDAGHFIEIQGTAEGHPFSDSELSRMLELARHGIGELFSKQREVLGRVEA